VRAVTHRFGSVHSRYVRHASLSTAPPRCKPIPAMTEQFTRADGAPGHALILLSDYRPPAWRIIHAELEFDLGFAATEVTATLRLEPDPDQPGAPLLLDGVDLELLAIQLNGAPLPTDRYRHNANGLRIEGIDRACVLHTRVRIVPEGNTRLEGLFRSGDALFTQCEAQGFRRITFFADRSDVMPTWRTTLRADKARFPVLLGNGNPLSQRDLDNGRHEAIWHNPHPTPCYLFALVAGNLACVGKDIVSAEGRAVRLQAWAAPADVARCGYALGAIERALRWDEQRFGRCYDLEVFNIVAAQDFTMGAMENKGLNIFNARYILADEEVATDADYLAIESVIGHEYFHNWSGNRVTLRDWFQLALKEGLTVFRDQEFVSDLHSREVKRIEDVRLLRSRQFAEDAGALAHPVRPAQYSEINNFYTLTVYEKGAELVRMLHTFLGERVFRRGMDRYFADNDGRAATVEDLLAAHETASLRDLMQFKRWYEQSGTPQVEIRDSYDANTGTYALDIRQHTPATSMQPASQPLHIPLRYALYAADGSQIDAKPQGDAVVRDGLIELTQTQHALVFDRLPERPLPTFNQGFSAPVKLRYDYTPEQLAIMARVERDALLRWDTMQRLATGVLLQQFEDGDLAQAALGDAIGDLLDDPGADPAFVSECMQLPDFDTLVDTPDAANNDIIDIDALLSRREQLQCALAKRHADRLQQRYRSLAEAAAQGLDGAAMSARRLRNACLAWLSRIDPQAALAGAQFAVVTRMTDRLAALRCLVHAAAPAAVAALREFQQRHRDDPLVTDKWIAVVATRPHGDALDDVRDLLASTWWTPTNPNRVRALLGSVSRMNPTAFHRNDGAGYRLLAEQLPQLDTLNPQVAARLLAGFENWRRLTDARKEHAALALQSLRGKLTSRDSIDLLTRLLVE
jgi:aminopeptidase N